MNPLSFILCFLLKSLSYELLNRRLLVLGLILSMTLFACGKDTQPNVKPTPLSTLKPSPELRKTTAGEQLFSTQLSSNDLATARKEFLVSTNCAQNTSSGGRTLYYYDVNYFEFDLIHVPQIPIFATYHQPGGYTTLSIRLPKPFWFNIPEVFQSEIKKRDITSLDLFIVIQEYISGTYHKDSNHAVRFRPHFWAAPLGPHPVGTSLSGDLQVMLFHFDKPIDGDLKENIFAKINWQIHPDSTNTYSLYSPANAMVNMDLSKANNSGWSLIIDERTGRAAVTLHGIYSDQPLKHSSHDALETLVRNYPNLNEMITQIAKDPQWSTLSSKIKELSN